MQFQPHPYQAYCINRLLTDPALGLFLDMGLGKTVITLTAINDLEYNRFAVANCGAEKSSGSHMAERSNKVGSPPALTIFNGTG